MLSLEYEQDLGLKTFENVFGSKQVLKMIFGPEKCLVRKKCRVQMDCWV